MSLTLLQLRTFVTVCRTGSIHAAARQLVVSQPSVSAVVGALEREVGTPLFRRVGRGIEPSAAGTAFLSYAREILALEKQAIDAATEAAEPGRGKLAIASVTTAAEYVLPSLLKRFGRANPHVEFTLEVGNRALVLDRIRSREADLGIGGRPPVDASVTGERFAANELIVVGSPSLESAGELSRHAWLVREAGSGTRSATEEFFARSGIEPASVLTLGSNGAVKEGARIGLGLALLPEIAVRADIRAKRISHVPVPGTPIERGWYVLARSDSPLRPIAASFAAFLTS